MAKFKKGRSGNPRGRPKGIVDRRSRYLALVEQNLPDVIHQVVSAALGGDMTACKMLLDKILPNVRPQTSPLRLPLNCDTDVDRAGAITAGLINGAITPEQASMAISVIVNNSQIREQAELEERLVALDQRSVSSA